MKALAEDQPQRRATVVTGGPAVYLFVALASAGPYVPFSLHVFSLHVFSLHVTLGQDFLRAGWGRRAGSRWGRR